MKWLIKKIVGTQNERIIKQIRPMVARINELEETLTDLSDDEIKKRSDDLRQRLQGGATTDEVLEEAFAIAKNACRRLMGTKYMVAGQEREWVEIPYDVQILGGIAMHQGRIAEMATGEGKTLVGIFPAYLNALTGRGVHIVTVNDYLARRDAEWMGLFYNFLNVSVGCIQNQMRPADRRVEYEYDITYGTNSEFGFDYLRDNMAYRPEDKVQRDYYFSIIDEIDSILIDEAKTPLIISGPAPNAGTGQYAALKPSVEVLVKSQRSLMDRIANEAEKMIEGDEEEDAMFRLYQLRQGMPNHPKLHKMMEDPTIRRMVEKVDSNMLTDVWKEKGRELREELFFVVDEKGHDANLTDKGCEAMSPNDPETYVLPDITEMLSELDGRSDISDEDRHTESLRIQDEYAKKSGVIHSVDQLIRAYSMYEADVDYVVQDNQVIIVDENTGRLMVGRRWSDGLHQAVEAKEGVKIEKETQTLATITIQNYFRLYEKLAGMTGTAETEADEFAEIYGLDVLVVPTNRPVRRVDHNDPIYKTRREKFNAIVDEIQECYNRKQPVLLGTITVEASEELSRIMRKRNIPHNVLNAKQHQAEAEIVQRAGQPGSVTIATNMAGRGTDIKLGEGVVEIPRDVIEGQISLDDKYNNHTLRQELIENPCGLYVIGSERHESRRTDRQLRGRCSRQGDPGQSRFYVSLEDDLMRLFGSDRISGIMEKLGIEEGEVMEHPWLNKSIERAQRKVEGHNFSIRKRTLEYDDVMNQQREVVYGFRSEILTDEEVRPHLYDILQEVVEDEIETIDPENLEGPLNHFIEWANRMFPLGIKEDDLLPIIKDPEAMVELVMERIRSSYELKVSLEDPERYGELERYFMLQAIDLHWQEYLRAMDGLRQSVGLMAYGQRDPLIEFKHSAYDMFADLMLKIKEEIAGRTYRSTTSAEAMNSFLGTLQQKTVHRDVSALDMAREQGTPAEAEQKGQAVDEALERVSTPIKRETPKVGRNEPCPCGSGKKYKQCCGKN